MIDTRSPGRGSRAGRLKPALLGLLTAAQVGAPGEVRAASSSPSAPGPPAPTGTAGERGSWYPVVFFPPMPPVYGARIPERPADTRWRFYGHRLTPPEGLADFTGEFLYAPLSVRLNSRSLTRALEQRLEAYRARRSALVNELLNQCVALHDADDDTRERELRRFAGVQTPAIAALEAEADELRRELTRSRLGLDLGWNAGRKWKLDSLPPGKDWMRHEAEFQLVRAAAFYEDGLLPAQRGLLRELALELDRPARKARGERLDSSEAEAMFFSPETTRLRLPPDLPREVLDRIAAYNGQKAALKEQLRAAIRQHEKAPAADRTAAFARLADEQWPQFSELEALAEALRADLGPRFIPAPPQKPPAIPAWLITVIHSYNEDRDTYFGEMRQMINEALAGIPRPPRGDNSDEVIRQQDEYGKRQDEAKRKAVVAFQEQNEARFAALARRHEAIRTALEAIAKTTTDPKTGRPLNVDMLLRQHALAMEEFDVFGRASAIYTTYRTAMLQRGLSPEQRRLLFSYGITGLAQPLPYGELLPRSGAKFPIPR